MRTSAANLSTAVRVTVAGAIVLALAIAAPAASAVSPSPSPSSSPAPAASPEPSPPATPSPGVQPEPSSAPRTRGDGSSVFDPSARRASIAEGGPTASFEINRPEATEAEHEIYVVPMSPDLGTPYYNAYNEAQQGIDAAGDAAEQAADYWGDVLGGHQTFVPGAYIEWDATYSNTETECYGAGVGDLMEEAAVIAAAESGYTAGANQHLIILLAAGHECDEGKREYATFGDVNSGGVSIVRGSTSVASERSWRRVLGTNMGFGDASSKRFNSGSASTLNEDSKACAGCDWYDVQSKYLSGQPGGVISSPSLVETGIWEDGVDFDYGFIGTNTYRINAMSKLEGKRGIAVLDPHVGDRMYIEHRSFTGYDKKVAKKKDAGSGPELGKGVRLMIADGSGETWVSSRQGKKSKGYYVAGNSFNSDSGDVEFKVKKITNDYADIELTIADDDLTPGTVSLTGDAYYGQLLGFSSTPWTSTFGSDFVYSYQWYRDGVEIDGATSGTYVTTVDDIGSRVSMRLMGYEDDATSAIGAATSPKTPVIKAVPIAAEPVSILGTARVGEELIALTDLWSAAIEVNPEEDIVYSYQWYRGSNKISGATDFNYELTKKDLGKRIRVKVTCYDLGLVTTSKKSAKTAEVKKGIIEGTLSTVVGVTAPSTLEASPDGITEPGVTEKFRWYRNGNKIKGAKTDTYVLKDKDRNKIVQYKVWVKKPGYVTVAAKSPSIDWTVKATPAKPEITGDPSVDSTLVYSDQEFAVPGNSEKTVDFDFQWYRGDKKISGATSNEYTLTGADAGKRISLKVIAHDPVGYYLRYIGKSAKTATVTN